MVITEVFWDSLSHPALHNRLIYLAATEAGLIQITLPNESFAEVERWVSRKIGVRTFKKQGHEKYRF